MSARPNATMTTRLLQCVRKGNLHAFEAVLTAEVVNTGAYATLSADPKLPTLVWNAVRHPTHGIWFIETLMTVGRVSPGFATVGLDPNRTGQTLLHAVTEILDARQTLDPHVLSWYEKMVHLYTDQLQRHDSDEHTPGEMILHHGELTDIINECIADSEFDGEEHATDVSHTDGEHTAVSTSRHHITTSRIVFKPPSTSRHVLAEYHNGQLHVRVHTGYILVTPPTLGAPPIRVTVTHGSEYVGGIALLGGSTDNTPWYTCTIMAGETVLVCQSTPERHVETLSQANSIFITDADMEMATVRVEPRIQLLHDEQTCLLSVTTIIVFQEQIDDVDDDVTTQTIIETNVFRLE